MNAKSTRPTARISATSGIKRSALAGARSGTRTPPAPATQQAPQPDAEDTAPAAARAQSAPPEPNNAGRTAQEPAQPSKTAGKTRQQRTFGIESQLLDRLRGAAESLPNKVKDQGILSMNDLLNHLLGEALTRYEADHHKGKPYKKPGRGLPPGRRIGG